jgi:hypothetical protein
MKVTKKQQSERNARKQEKKTACDCDCISMEEHFGEKKCSVFAVFVDLLSPRK